MLELLLSRAQAAVVASAPQEGGAAPGHHPRGRQREQDRTGRRQERDDARHQRGRGQAGRLQDQAGRLQDRAPVHERAERT